MSSSINLTENAVTRIQGLSADSDNDKNITLGELYSYLSDKVKDKSSKLGRQQNPQLSGDKDKVLVSLN